MKLIGGDTSKNIPTEDTSEDLKLLLSQTQIEQRNSALSVEGNFDLFLHKVCVWIGLIRNLRSLICLAPKN